MTQHLPAKARSAIEAGPIAHIVTLDDDGSPHVSLAWVGLDGDDIVFGTLPDQRKLRNLRRDPRIAISFQTGRRTTYGLDEYAVLNGTATVEPGGGPELLQRLARVYLGPDVVFPGPGAPPGFVTRVRVDRVSGLGMSSD